MLSVLYSRSAYLSLPSKPGVYIYLDANKNILYVGKAKDLKSRVSSYFTSPVQLGTKTRALVEQIDKIQITIVESELESLLLEVFYIKKYRPRYNIKLTDDKSYPLIKITKKDTFPAVLLSRKIDDPRAIYFGPFPSSGSVKSVLKTLRRAFPYKSVVHHPKHRCLYNHLGLCPCPEAFDSPLVRQDYKKNIHNIIRVLEGKSQVVLKELQKEMEKSSKLEKFEDALKYKAQIDALSVITQPSHTPFEYDINPNLRTDIRDSEIEMLIQALSNAGLHVSGLQRIECYDISNISGTHATGSLVVLSDGEIDKSQYRKFKIKKDGSPNDFAMMKEMLERRLKHDEWPCPSLIVIDGGKGQLSSVLEAMYLTQKYFPVVGLAKREETIIVPVHQPFFNPASKNLIEVTESNYKKLYGDNEENFVEISLPKDSGSLHLIQRIRNEAHRFAITYHRGLRSKGALKE